MKLNIQAIIFDWGRTLYSSELKGEFPESESVITECLKRGYRLAAVSLVSPLANATLKEREKQIEYSPLRKYFEFTAVTDGDKDLILDEVVSKFGLPRTSVLIVDDRVVRGIKYGNMKGHPTVWLQKGKFKEELPSEDTGNPTFVIHSLDELLKLI